MLEYLVHRVRVEQPVVDRGGFTASGAPPSRLITGAAQPKLNQKALNSIPIPIPKAVEERAKIVKSLESLQKETTRLAAIYQQKLAALEALKKSLHHKPTAGSFDRLTHNLTYA